MEVGLPLRCGEERLVSPAEAALYRLRRDLAASTGAHRL
ncbi:MAG: hypothetical protein AVDCRST_MAG49-1990 [uncultured Thermomicrobiales bacterium]|uniref:Uncharacterized protein n=1 Tax=uncultured Thermomicrobiales bacterium TaxID=1645740 RepID=A0A6J4ULU0_9BACT|nr:MAG: hypothetical protein AVDCRST_MAG49-1990 [uncultured Thermomicrobiales bacterium]